LSSFYLIFSNIMFNSDCRYTGIWLSYFINRNVVLLV